MKKVFVLICISVLFIGCAKKSQSQTVSVTESQTPAEVKIEENIIFEEPADNSENEDVSMDYHHHTDDPKYWTNEKQKEVYEQLFKNNLEESLNFRTFVESLAQYHHNEPYYEYNPVFLCLDNYPENLQFFLENRPDLFLRGSLSYGDYSETPFVYAVKNGAFDSVKFYFEHNIPILELPENILYGDRAAGGPRFGIGGNVLSYTNEGEIRDFLISKGVPEEIPAEPYFYYYLKNENANVYLEPGLNNTIVKNITKEDSFNAVSVLAYRVDNLKWMKITGNDFEGWIPDTSFDYDSGI